MLKPLLMPVRLLGVVIAVPLWIVVVPLVEVVRSGLERLRGIASLDPRP